MEDERKALLLKHAKEIKKQIVEKEENANLARQQKDIENKKFKETWEAQKHLV